MGINKNFGPKTSLDELLAEADADTLRELVRQLCGDVPAIQRESLDVLRLRIRPIGRKAREAAGQSVLLLWQEIEPYVSDECWAEEDEQVYSLLAELGEQLGEERVPSSVRRHVVDEALEYVESTGFQDPLYDLLYAASYTEEDLRYLADRLEGTGRDWPLEHARRIYRHLGDRTKYLELRNRKLVYGLDFYDLVTFYEECGESERALAVAKEGLEKGQGQVDDLRQFLAQHALRMGDRATYLELQFQQAANRITVKSYQEFRRLCTDSEWVGWESRLMEAVAHQPAEDRLKIHLLREERNRPQRFCPPFATHGTTTTPVCLRPSNLWRSDSLKQYWPSTVRV